MGKNDFNPRLFNEEGVGERYEDGLVSGDVKRGLLPDGRSFLRIDDWLSEDPGNGHSSRALRWLRPQFNVIIANGVGEMDDDGVLDISGGYWSHEASKGLVDQILLDDGTELDVGIWALGGYAENLRHATARKNLAQIAAEGLRDFSYWANENVSAYYGETVEDEGEEPVYLSLPLCVLQKYQPDVDQPGIDEPLTFTLRMSEEEVQEAWGETNGSWQACLGLIGSMRCRAAIPASVLARYNPEVQELLAPARTPKKPGP